MAREHSDRAEAAGQRDAEDLRAHIHQFVRRFGLLVTRQTPCGFPVSPSYAHALMLILRRTSDGLTTLQSDLAAGLGIDKSNVARLCERMVRAGHVLQHVPPGDGRSRLVTLTPKGTRVAERIEQGSRDRFAAVASNIPARKRRAVIGALIDLNAAIARIPGEGHP
jgi:DNA-binding MarR family transcriptional regulator